VSGFKNAATSVKSARKKFSKVFVFFVSNFVSLVRVGKGIKKVAQEEKDKEVEECDKGN